MSCADHITALFFKHLPEKLKKDEEFQQYHYGNNKEFIVFPLLRVNFISKINKDLQFFK